MSSTVTLPTWLVVLAGILAAIGLLDRLLMPGVRWMLHRRLNKAIDRLNTTLSLQIQPFKLTRRRDLRDRLLFDPEVLKAVEKHAEENDTPREVAMNLARRYADEIVPAFSAYAYFKIGARLARKVSQTLYRVRLGATSEEALKDIDPDSTVIFVMNHRSNMDYVLLTYMAAKSSALSYAVGEWARVWPLQQLIRSMGAYFIRRDSRNDLYRKVLARYVHMATRAGVTQAVFPEGGLSRDGALRPPKFGLLNYMVCGFDPRGVRDVLFIPVGINYDRVLEDRVLVSAASAAAENKRPKFKFRPSKFLKFLAHGFWLRIQGKWHRYGYACVSFGDPVSLRKYIAEHNVDFRTLDDQERFKAVRNLGEELMRHVGHVLPALPVALVATVLLQAHPKKISGFELKGSVHTLMKNLEEAGNYVHVPHADREYAVEVGLRMLTLRHLVTMSDGLYAIAEGELDILRYYANSIAHIINQEALPASSPDEKKAPGDMAPRAGISGSEI